MIILRKLKPLFYLLLGLLTLLYLGNKAGFGDIARYLREVGTGLAFPITIAGTWYVFNCLAWVQFIEKPIPLRRLFIIKVIGETVNTTTPLSWVGGDPVRIALMRPFVPTNEGTASVILDRTIHSFATALMMGAGLALALFTLNLPDTLRYSLIGAMGVIGVGLTFAIWHQHRGILNGLVLVLDRLKLGRFINDAARSRIASIDGEIQRHYRDRKGRLIASLLFHVIGRLLGILEIYVIAILLHIDLSFLNAYFLAMLNALINFAFVFIPGSVGVLEGAYGGLFHILHFDPAAGVALQLVRRLRTLFWIGIGFILMAIYKKKGDSHGSIA